MQYSLAVRTDFLPLGKGKKYIRITAEGCVNENDLHRLRNLSARSMRVMACGEIKLKDMVGLWVEVPGGKGRRYLADIRTGTLYRESTGMSSSPNLFIIKD